MGGHSSTITTEQPKVGNLKLNNSCYGAPVPIVFGTTRVNGNLIDYNDFTAIQHVTEQDSGGGKGGGGVTQKDVTYTYTVTFDMLLGEGGCAGIIKIWKDKDIYSPEQLGLNFYGGWENQVPFWYMSSKHPERALSYANMCHTAFANFDLGSDATLPVLSFELSGIGASVTTVQWVEWVQMSIEEFLEIAKQNMIVAIFMIQSGRVSALKPVYHTTVIPTVYDASPLLIIKNLLSNPRFGVNFTDDFIDDLAMYSAYCAAMGIWLSPALTEQEETAEIIKKICQLTNSEAFWSEGKLKIVPYGDETVTANGVTYTPINSGAPIYDLTDDNFICEKGDDPVTCERKVTADAYNCQPLEYLNRANSYNVEVVEAKDQASIEQYGLRQADTIQAHWICDSNIAKIVAQLILQRQLYVRNVYSFTLSWKYCLLEQMDIVTITDEGLGLDKLPVRITKIEEDDGELHIEAEECPYGVHHATLYPNEPADRFEPRYNISPGSCNAPIIFEPPSEITSTGLETWIATSGGTNWGGCSVWVSEDGDSYKRVGKITGSARQGTITADSGTKLSVDLSESGGLLLSVSQVDAYALRTLCYADGELLAYQNAELTENGYNLTGLNRGAYNTPISQHAAGKPFARLDDTVFKYPFSRDDIGKKIFIKLTSFNIYGGAEQSLADVEPIEHNLTWNLPPAASNISFDENTYILKDGTALTDLRISFTEPAFTALDHYNVYYDINDSGQWDLAGQTNTGQFTLKALPNTKTIKVKITTVDKFTLENSGAISSSYTITGKSDPPSDVTGLTAVQNEYNRAEIILAWSPIDRDINPDLKGYEVRLGTIWETAQKIGNLVPTENVLNLV